MADDDESDRLLFMDAFSELKIETHVRPFKDGVQLMDWLHTGNTPLPELIFLDLNMPRKNGMECLKEIRGDKKYNSIYIAIYSTSDNDKDVEEAFQSGANIYITKPTSFDTLKQALEKAVLSAFLHQDVTLRRDVFMLRI